MPRSRSKESAWERGLKVSKKIRDEVKRNEKSDDESDDSHPGMKVSDLSKFWFHSNFKTN